MVSKINYTDRLFYKKVYIAIYLNVNPSCDEDDDEDIYSYTNLMNHISKLDYLFHEMARTHQYQLYKQKYIKELLSIETIEKDKRKDEIDYNILRLVNLEKVKIMNNETKIKNYIQYNKRLPQITKYKENFELSKPVKFLEDTFMLEKYDYTYMLYL